MSVPTLQDPAANAELEQRIQDYIEDDLGDHKLFHRNNPLPQWERDRTPSPSPVSDPQSESDDATMSETSSQAEFSAYAQEQQQRDKECDEEAWKEQQQQLKELREQDAAWKSILHDLKHPPSSPPDVVATTLRDIFRQPRPHRNPPSSSDESSEDDFEVSDHSSDDDYAPSEGSSEMYESDGFEEPTEQQRRLERQQISRLKMQLMLSQGSEECAKQSIRDHMNAAMMRDMLVEEQRELIEQQQKTAEQKDAEVSSIKQELEQQQKTAEQKDAEVSSIKQELEQVKQQFKQQTAMVQALTSRQQATQQDVTRTANAIVSTQPTAQIEDLLTQFGSMSLGHGSQGSQVSANVVFSAKSELDRRSSRVPEASSSLKNKVEDLPRPGSDTLKVPKVEYQARTKQTARATTSQPAPRRAAAAAPAGGAGSDDGDGSDDGTPTAEQSTVYGEQKLNELATESGFCIHQVAEVFFPMLEIASQMAEMEGVHTCTQEAKRLIFDQAIAATKGVLCLSKMENGSHARTKQTARATTSQPAPRRAAPAAGGSDDSSDDSSAVSSDAVPAAPRRAAPPADDSSDDSVVMVYCFTCHRWVPKMDSDSE